MSITKYQVQQLRRFYGVKTQWAPIMTDTGPLEFDSRDAAQDLIDEFDCQVHYQGHNEYGRPSYKIVEVAK